MDSSANQDFVSTRKSNGSFLSSTNIVNIVLTLTCTDLSSPSALSTQNGV